VLILDILLLVMTPVTLKNVCLRTDFVIICSVATEPDFKAWITTTKVYHKFHESVGFYISDISFKNYNSVLDIHLAEQCYLLTSYLLCSSQVRIAMVGKYTGLSDAYLSVLKVLLINNSLFFFFLHSQQLAVLVVHFVKKRQREISHLK